MLINAKIVAFVATSNSLKACQFYGDVLGLKEIDDTPFATVFEANGVVVRVQKVDVVTPQPYTILGWEVQDIGVSVQCLVDKGAVFEQFDKLDQNDGGIWTAPDGTQVAWLKDPDGNMLSISEYP